MRPTIRKYCPCCLTRYDSYFSHKPPKCSGAPLRICGQCGHEFIDPDYIEPYFDAPPTPISLLGAAYPYLILFGLPSVLFFTEKTWWVAAILIGLFIYFTWKQYDNRYIDLRKIEADYEESRIRTQDPEYIKMLFDNECYVPQVFLETHHPELLSYKRKGWTKPRVERRQVL